MQNRFAAVLAIVCAVTAWAETAIAEPIEVDARPIPSFGSEVPIGGRIGPLRYLGGLELSSVNEAFGGFSAIEIDPSGETIVMATDQGMWLTARLVTDDGRPSGLADVVMEPMRGQNGRPLTRKFAADAEALAALPAEGGVADLVVGFERMNRLRRYPIHSQGLDTRAYPIDVPPALEALPENKGIEGIVVIPDGVPMAGALIAISERPEDGAGSIPAWIIGGPTPGDFGIARIDGFDITDAAVLPSGDVLVLERRFRAPFSLRIALRRIDAAAIMPGAEIDGERILEVDWSYAIDNMEGLAVHTNESGESILTLVSDDNFNTLQRTLLLQFALVETDD